MIFLYINGRSRFCRQHLALSWRSTFYLHICQIELNSLGASQYKWWHSNNQKAVDSFKSQRHESYWQLQVTKTWILLSWAIAISLKDYPLVKRRLGSTRYLPKCFKDDFLACSPFGLPPRPLMVINETTLIFNMDSK